MKLINKKCFLYCIIAYSITIPFTITSYDLSHHIKYATKAIQNIPCGIQQRIMFARVIARALYNYKNNDQHTVIEQKLAQHYTQWLDNNSSIQHAAQDLYNAIKTNPYLTIQPSEFILGASSSAYQIEGGLDHSSAAARFYAKKAKLPTAGIAIDFYNRYKEDIKQMKEELHINAFRISLAWDRIQPQQGKFSQEAIAFYKDVLQTLIAHDIKPLVVFHHYDVPTWFEDLGGFEKKKNGKFFQEFALHVYKELAQELGSCIISMCCAAEGPAFKGYFTGEGTPGEKDNLHKTHTVIANMYYEMVDTALAFKKSYIHLKKTRPSIQPPYIGIQINIVPIDPHPDVQQPCIKTALGCSIGAYVQGGGVFNFLVNGEYRVYTPDISIMKQTKGANVYRYHPEAHKAFDWIGVNVYSNNFLNGFERINGNKLIESDEERYTDNTNYRNYPEGIYRAVQMVAENVTIPLGAIRNADGRPLPILVTENGIATKDDAKRTRYFKKALCSITQLIKDGYRVEGYLPWTSHDNFEWPTQDNPDGFGSKNYGFFAVNRDKNSPDYLKRTLKEGSRGYAAFAHEFFNLA